MTDNLQKTVALLKHQKKRQQKVIAENNYDLCTR